MEIYSFTEEELTIAKQIVFANHLGNPKQYQSEHPFSMLLGGQPAAGKTGLIHQLRGQYSQVKFVVINGDEYRQYHPRARQISAQFGQNAPNYTQPFSNALVEYLKMECLRLRCNFIIEGTMRSYAVIERTALEAKQAGFRCEAHVLAVARQDSLLGIFQRFEGDKQRTGMGRFSSIETHDEAYRQIPVNLNQAYRQQLFDRMVIYTRGINGVMPSTSTTKMGTSYIDFEVEFEKLRIPQFDKTFYQKQWLVIQLIAHQRGETDATYLRQLDTCMRLSNQEA